MWKKVLTMLLIVCLVFTMTACAAQTDIEDEEEAVEATEDVTEDIADLTEELDALGDELGS